MTLREIHLPLFRYRWPIFCRFIAGAGVVVATGLGAENRNRFGGAAWFLEANKIDPTSGNRNFGHNSKRDRADANGGDATAASSRDSRHHDAGGGA